MKDFGTAKLCLDNNLIFIDSLCSKQTTLKIYASSGKYTMLVFLNSRAEKRSW